MKKIMNRKSFYLFYCFILAFAYLLFTSKNSFLYAFNEWGDANSFFTVGKSMFRGVIPYRDLFEQKGLLLYVIYGFGSLLSATTFHGVFILEVLFFGIFLYYTHKTINLFLNEKYSLLLLPILTFFILTSLSFSTGGSAEEFCLPMFAYSFYSFFKYFKFNLLSKKFFFYNGIMAGIVFMIKYSMLGFWFGFIFFIVLHLLVNKQVKESFIVVVYFLLGMFIPFGLCSIYLLFHNAFTDFIDCYFIANIKYYSESFHLLFRLRYIAIILAVVVYNSHFIVKYLFMWLGVFLIPIKLNRYAKVSVLLLFILSHIGIYWGLKEFPYYFLPMYIFLLIPLIGICIFLKSIYNLLKDKLNWSFSFSNKYLNYTFFSIFFVFMLVVSYLSVSYKNDLGKSRGDIFQYQFAQYIKEYDNPTLLNVGGLDMGVYTTTNIIPTTRFFHLMNFDYNLFPNNLDSLRDSVENKEIQFIVYTTYPNLENVDYDFSDYELVYKVRHQYENLEKETYLFQLRDNNE